jgi:hypothetical protein
MSKAEVRLICVIMLLTPPLTIWWAPVFREALFGELPVLWLPTAALVHFGVAVFFFAAPFIVQFLSRRQRSHFEAIGVDIDQLLLLMGIGGSAGVVVIALFLFAFGGTIDDLFGWAALSFGIGLFWFWRLRHVLW